MGISSPAFKKQNKDQSDLVPAVLFLTQNSPKAAYFGVTHF
jgi:hypothetical protein